MKFSVIIPCFNAESTISATLESLVRQDYRSMEVLIMDGGSSDQTSAKVNSFEDDRFFWHSSPDEGQLHAIEKGLTKTTGDIVYFLNADDIAMPNAFHTVANVFTTRPQVDLVYSDNYVFSETSRHLGVGATIKGLTFDDHFLFYRQMYSECVFWRAERSKMAIPVDRRLRVFTDYALFLPIRREAICHWVPQRLGAFRVLPNQMSQIHRDRHQEEFHRVRGAMRERLGWSQGQYRVRRWLHAPSFIIRQWIRPRFESALRFLYRRVSGDRERSELSNFFFSCWLRPTGAENTNRRFC